MTHICNQRLYLLNQLKKQSLPRAELQSIFVAIVLSRLLYASPSWNGCATASNMESLKTVLMKAKHWQIDDKDYVLEELFLIVTGRFSVQHRATIIVLTIYF